MELRAITILLVVIAFPSLNYSEDINFEVVSPERSDLRRALRRGVRPAYIRGGYSVQPHVKFTSKANPTPDELLELFCEEIFYWNSSAIMNLNLGHTSVSNDYVINLARHLGYPVISWDRFYSGTLQSDEDNLVLQLAPTIYHECYAMILLLERYNWTAFSILTTSDVSQDFIECMEDMVKRTSIVQGYLTIPRYTNIATVVLDGPLDDFFDVDQEAIVREDLNTFVRVNSRVILLHTRSTSDALNIVEVATAMGLTGNNYAWLATTSCVGDLEYSTGTKLPVGFLGLSSNRSTEMLVETVRMGLTIMKEAVTAMVKAGDTSNMYPTHSCDNTTDMLPWPEGKTLYRYMKAVEIKKEDEPPISFRDNGIIEHVGLNLVNIRPPNKPRTGRRRRPANSWDTVGRIGPVITGSTLEMKVETKEIMWPGHAISPPRSRPEKRFFRVVTKEEEPFIMYVAPDNTTGKCGANSVPCVVQSRSVDSNSTTNTSMDYCCTGLCVEVLELLAARMNFEYVLYDVPDGQWGVQDPETREWNGLIKELVDGEADMILSAFIINQIRSTMIDFSVPFLESGITIMVSIRKGAISPYAFLEPYDLYSWILILLFSVHATGASIFIFEWLSPSGLGQGKTSTIEHKFSLFRSFWLIWAMLFGAAVSIDVPRGVSSRFLANVWALFALVFLASYTANLAAFMITIDEYYDLSGIEDWRLLNPTKLTPHFKFATITNSSTDVNLKINYPTMHKYMTKYNKDDVATALEALKNNTIHAFIYDANVLEYTAGRDPDCSLLTVGRWYAMSGYGVGFRRGSKLQEEVNTIVLNLQYTGEIERLQAFWLSGACHAKTEKDKSSNKIGILNFISAFILLAAGVMLGAFLLLLEHLYFKSGRKCLKKYDKCGCCALVSLSMGKSLTFEQSVFETIDIHKKHKCKDPICEMHLWKARHQLDMALLKMKQVQAELDTALKKQVRPMTTAEIETIT